MGILKKVLHLLSLKLLHAENKDLLTENMKELVSDERSWTSQLFKLYYSMRKMEKRKYSGDGFTSEIRQITSYFAVKHLLWPADKEFTVYDENASRMSSVKKSPRHGKRSHMTGGDFLSPNPSLSKEDRHNRS